MFGTMIATGRGGPSRWGMAFHPANRRLGLIKFITLQPEFGA